MKNMNAPTVEKATELAEQVDRTTPFGQELAKRYGRTRIAYEVLANARREVRNARESLRRLITGRPA